MIQEQHNADTNTIDVRNTKTNEVERITLGQHWQDRDVRRAGRVIEVVEVGDFVHAVDVATKKPTTVSVETLIRRFRKLAEPAHATH